MQDKVTTPQEVSFSDVVKGIDMLESLKVPVVGVVENYSGFICNNCSTVHYPFNKNNHVSNLSQLFGIKHAIKVPMMEKQSIAGDDGRPILLRESKATTSNKDVESIRSSYEALVRGVTTEMIRLSDFDERRKTKVMYNEKAHKIVVRCFDADHAMQYEIAPIELRKQLREVDEMLSIPLPLDDVKPMEITSKGNYAVAIKWSDGHSNSIYTFDKLIQVAQAVQQQRK